MNRRERRLLTKGSKMADAETVIQQLGLQIGQLNVDKALLSAELSEARATIQRLESQLNEVAPKVAAPSEEQLDVRDVPKVVDPLSVREEARHQDGSSRA